MARRKQVPQTAKPTLRRRLIELGKDVLIVALTCSAVLLAAQTPMAHQLRELVGPSQKPQGAQSLQTKESVAPYGAAVRSSRGLYGVNYDQAAVGAVFERFSPTLGEALSTASQPEKLTEARWRALLEQPGLSFVFQGAPPLSVLSAWVGEDAAPEGRCELLALGWDGSNLWLGWRDGEDYYRARTGVAYEGYLAGLLEEFSPNGAAYAYTLSGSDGTYGTLDPYVLVTMASRRPMTYAASSPDLMGDSEALEKLLRCLGFRSGVNSAYETAGEKAINENGDRLRVNGAGRVIFHTGGEGRYPVQCAGEVPTAQEAAQAAGEVLTRACEPWKGEGGFVLTGAERTGEGWTVTFHTRLNGVPVLTDGDGWCAKFIIKGREISDFSLTLRTYTATGTPRAVLSERLAAAALAAKPNSGGKLTLCYTDNRAPVLSAGWVSEE